MPPLDIVPPAVPEPPWAVVPDPPVAAFVPPATLVGAPPMGVVPPTELVDSLARVPPVEPTAPPPVLLLPAAGATPPPVGTPVLPDCPPEAAFDPPEEALCPPLEVAASPLPASARSNPPVLAEHAPKPSATPRTTKAWQEKKTRPSRCVCICASEGFCSSPRNPSSARHPRG